MDLTVKIGKTTFKNPVWAASGTFGAGEDFTDFLDLGGLGAIVTKTITLDARKGNPLPRITETPSGLLNSIGLENKGVEHFRKETLPFLKKIRTQAVISVAGCTREELVRCVTVLARSEEVKAIEVNLSCPNIAHGGAKYALFSQDPQITEEVIRCIRKETDATLIAKLTPNVTDIAVIARAAENGGADAVSLVNTYLAMAVDAEEMKPLLGNVTGGLSGPAIKPMALRAVWEAHKAVSIPVIGIGGIMTGIDVAEFMLCGASAVQVGTANFVDPASPARVLKEFKGYLKRKKMNNLEKLVGKLRT